MRTVLVVDDEPAIRSYVRAALEGAGYRVLDAPDGASALELLARGERPDLILLDIALPGMNGLDLCRRLRNEPATAAIPVLLLTGLPRERRIADQAGATGVIGKPFSPTTLGEAVDRALRQPVSAS